MSKFLSEIGYGNMKPSQLKKVIGCSQRTARDIVHCKRPLTHEEDIKLRVGRFNKGNRYNNLNQIQDMDLLKENMHLAHDILIFEHLTISSLTERLCISRSTARKYIRRQKNSNRKKFHSKGIYFEDEIPYLKLQDNIYHLDLNYPAQRHVFRNQ